LTKSKTEGKLLLKIKEISKYQEIREPVFVYSDQISFIGNFPFKVCAILNPNKEMNEVDLGIYLDTESINETLHIK
jgi:hypothetical protein